MDVIEWHIETSTFISDVKLFEDKLSVRDHRG